MQHATMLREPNGRFLGKLDGQWFNSEDETYRDKKESRIIFPQHNHTQASEVITYNINDVNRN